MGNENNRESNSSIGNDNIEVSNFIDSIEENNEENLSILSNSNITLNSSIESINEINNDNYKQYYEKDKKSRKINGYPINSFIDINDINIINEFKCPICLDIVYKPEICSKCGTLFCKKCYQIYKMKTNENYCPICHSRNTISDNVSNSIINILNSFQLKCIFNGCNEILSLKDFKKHVFNCKYGLYKCSDCNFKGNFIEIEEHIKNCGAKIEICELCNEEYIKKESLNHLNECSQVFTKCNSCGYDIVNTIFKSHKENCKSRLFKCKFCHKGFIKKQFDEHNIKKCINLEIKKLVKKKKKYYKELEKYKKINLNLKQEISYLSKKKERENKLNKN